MFEETSKKNCKPHEKYLSLTLDVYRILGYVPDLCLLPHPVHPFPDTMINCLPTTNKEFPDFTVLPATTICHITSTLLRPIIICQTLEFLVKKQQPPHQHEDTHSPKTK